jgi:threonine dehydrogenase-like Zn-dependent dehydrogenase
VIDASEGEVAERIRELTDGRGADVCLEVSGNYRALHEAIRSVAYNSRVCVAGFMQGEGAGLRLGEEFHHNRVQLVCAQISGVQPALQHRWDEYRLQRTFVDLAVSGRVNVTDLITHEYDLEQGGEAFELLDTATSDVLQVVLKASAQ